MVLITYRIEKFLMGRVTFPTWPAAKDIRDTSGEHGVLPGGPRTYQWDHVNQALLTILFSLVEESTSRLYTLRQGINNYSSILLMVHIVLT